MGRHRRWLAAATIVAGCTGTGSGDVMAPPPGRHFDETAEPAPELPATVVDLPLLVDITTAVNLLEQSLPRRFGDINQRQPVAGNKRAAFAFQIRRDPFRVSVKNDTFVVAATIHYQGKGWYKPPIAPEVGGSCGLKGDEPRARVAISFLPVINRDWKLIAHPRLSYLGPYSKTERDQCEVTFLNLDVTSKVLDAARTALTAELPRLARELKTLNVKAEVEKVWDEIQKPIQLTDSVWLILQPQGVRLGELTGTKEMLGGTIGISAHPKIETGPKPTVAHIALPALDPPAPATGLSMLVEGRFEYPLIGMSLTEALKGKKIKMPGGEIELQEIGAFGIGGGRLAFGVRFTGPLSGQIYFVGTPRYDDSTGRIVVPDLDYDASTVSLLAKGLAWLKADALRDFLRTHASFPSTDAVDKLAALAVKGMNRQLTTGVFLSAALSKTQVLRLLPRADALYLQARTEGQATLHVTDDFFGQFAAHPSGSDTTAAGAARKTATPPK